MSFTWRNGRWLSTTTLNDGTKVTYRYNANGMRTQKKVGSKVTDYYYDSNNNLIAEKTDNATLFFYYDTENSPVALSYNGKMFYYVKNLQGDIVKILDEDGQEKASYVYNAWGDILSQSNDELASINPLRYRGYVYDEDTTLYYLQTRYYDPTTGRFINADDTAYIGATGTVLSANIFTYCENDPYNKTDYSGNSPKSLYKKSITTNKKSSSYHKKFKIVYERNGGKGKYMQDTTVVYGKKVQLRGRTYHKSYYIFKGWTAYRKSDGKWLCQDQYNLSKRRWLSEQELKQYNRKYEKYLYKDKSYVSKTSGTNNDIVYMYAQWSKKVFKIIKNEKDSFYVIGDNYNFPYSVDVHLIYEERYHLSDNAKEYYYRSLYILATTTNSNASCTFGFTGICHEYENRDIFKRFKMKKYGTYMLPPDPLYFISIENKDSVTYRRSNKMYSSFSFSCFVPKGSKIGTISRRYHL